MPIHDFKCDKCGEQEEKIVSFKVAEEGYKCACGKKCIGMMKKTSTPTGTTFILKGRFS